MECNDIYGIIVTTAKFDLVKAIGPGPPNRPKTGCRSDAERSSARFRASLESQQNPDDDAKGRRYGMERDRIPNPTGDRTGRPRHASQPDHHVRTRIDPPPPPARPSTEPDRLRAAWGALRQSAAVDSPT